MILGSNEGDGANRENPLGRPGETFDNPRLLPLDSSGPTGRVGIISSFPPETDPDPDPDPEDRTLGAEILLVNPSLVGAGLEGPPNDSLRGSRGLSGCFAMLVLLDLVVTVVDVAAILLSLDMSTVSSLDGLRCCKCLYRSSSNSPIRSNKIAGALRSGV